MTYANYGACVETLAGRSGGGVANTRTFSTDGEHGHAANGQECGDILHVWFVEVLQASSDDMMEDRLAARRCFAFMTLGNLVLAVLGDPKGQGGIGALVLSCSRPGPLCLLMLRVRTDNQRSAIHVEP